MRTRILLSTLALLAVLTGVGPSHAVGQQGGIQGRVTVGGVPVEDAEVSILTLGRRTRVDASGRYSFTDLPAGTYAVEASSPRRGRVVETVRVAAGETVELALALVPAFHLDEIVVSAGAGAMRRSEAYQPASVVTSRDLLALAEATLGETLSRQPGVNSTYFGPGSSRPVIRGIGGDRVRILESGIGVGDASSTSPDHAVGLEPRAADRIEVIRGPATLLYGSSAVGGIVNVLDNRIARDLPTAPLSGYVEVLGGTVSDERTASGDVTGRAGRLVLNAQGLWRTTSDYNVPDLSDADPVGGSTPGTLENSAIESRRGSLGLTYVGTRGYLGAAWSGMDSRYGIPGEAEGGEEERVNIDLDQTRLDLNGILRFQSGLVQNLKLRLGLADYRHVELEGDEVGTTFDNDYFEGRLESEHQLADRLHGAVGAQLVSRDFRAVGDEAFVPPSETRSFALFAYEEFEAFESLRLLAGLRLERQAAETSTSGSVRRDNAVSASTGVNWSASDILSLALSTSRSVKLPNAEELFSFGPHLATGAFEIGNPELGKETALGFDFTAHLHMSRIRGSASAFATRFSDYIYESATGEEEDGLTVFEFTQDDARFTGFEIEAELDALEGDPSAGHPHLSLELMADFVTAKFTRNDEYLPRIPPLRFGGGLNYRQGGVIARTSVRRTMSQTRVGPFEDETPGFTLVDGSISYRLFTGDVFHDITLVGANLTDQVARQHTSFLKASAPLPGREIRLVYRLNF